MRLPSNDNDTSSSSVHPRIMISPALFAVLHLVIILAMLVGLALSARPSRMSTSRHRGVRYRRLTTDEVLKRLAKEGRWEED